MVLGSVEWNESCEGTNRDIVSLVFFFFWGLRFLFSLWRCVFPDLGSRSKSSGFMFLVFGF